jgi:hypothetical protein
MGHTTRWRVRTGGRAGAASPDGRCARPARRFPARAIDQRVLEADADVPAARERGVDDGPARAAVAVPQPRGAEPGHLGVDLHGQVDGAGVVALVDHLDEDAPYSGGPWSREQRGRVVEGEEAGLDADPALEQGAPELDRAGLGEVERDGVGR